MAWVKCSERIPYISEIVWRSDFPVLVHCEIGVIPAYYGYIWHEGKKYYGFIESLRYGDAYANGPELDDAGLIKNVTHWQPLPEPPTE